ncbi:Ribonuclease P protein subunit p40 [Colletotrichum sp. SAR 10_96]|nr:Ribonuclease P protein subunit p40 [Colletotrichum sp. SAR 10_96]
MLSFPAPSVYQSPKCFVSYGTMAHVEPKQLPTKGKPWAPILGQGFNHKVDLILPQECYELVHQKLAKELVPPTFYRVTMTLGQVLDGAFFTEYIKRAPSPEPLEQYFPTRYTCEPSVVTDCQVQMAPLTVPSEVIESGDRPSLEDYATETYEWLSLIRLQSPRVAAGDNIDPYLSRYQTPTPLDSASLPHDKICKITWQGFFTPAWVRSVLITALVALPSRAWFSLSATSFSKGLVGDSTEVAFLRPPESPGHYLFWEIKGDE